MECILMSDNKDIHNKIIRSLCKELLLPLGVIQKGNSRVYLDDNGFYLTMIEFQPSAWGKGTYLNAGVHFLWNTYEYLSFDAYIGKSIRVNNFIQFRNDEQFEEKMRGLIAIAIDRVLFYRDIRNVRNAILNMHSDNSGINRSMFLALHGELNDDTLSQELVIDRIQQKRHILREKAVTRKLPWNEKFDKK